MDLIAQAQEKARQLVEPLGRRWLHVQTVAAKAETYQGVVATQDRETLVAAAWLHDIGYAPELVDTGLHPLDGARHLRNESWPSAVVNLVAHHSGARFEAVERGLAAELSEFPFEDTVLSDALATADLTTGPGGETVSYQERIDEVLQRYAPGDPVHRFWIKARPIIGQAIARTEKRLVSHPK